MSANARKIADMVELLPEHEQGLILDLVSRLIPDDVATPQDLADIEEARKDYANGETVRLEDLGL